MRSFLLAFALGAQLLHAQVNISLLGQLDYQALHNSDLSNIWGYADEFGNEYALIGVNGAAGDPGTGGLSVVDITDAANPVEVFFTASANSNWREIKTWGDYAYVTTEAEVGLMIVDLSPLPFSTALPVTIFQGSGWTTSHSLFIDENGRLYLHGSDRGNGGVIMYDLTADPMAPVEVGEFDNWYCHDSYARGDTLYGAHIYDGFFSIVDVSDPASPVLLGTRNTPNDFTHNVWLDASGQHLFTTDERTNAYIGSYDVSDPSDIEFNDKIQSDPGSGTVPHNTYWLNNFLVTSYYTYGVTIHDASRPHNLVETGHYDTSPFSGDGFRGAWGVYPFFPSGRLVVSDIGQGLVILAPTYVPACWLEGTVTDANTGLPLFNASVTLGSTGIVDQTSLLGAYGSGYHGAGSFDVTFSRPGYFPQTITNVALLNGQVTQINVALVPLPNFTFTGEVRDAGSGDGVPDAVVVIESSIYFYSATTDVDGNFSISTVYEDTYTITAGRWGWRTDCSNTLPLLVGAPPVTISIGPGYADDFALDLGWTEEGDAETGMWVRDVPVGTTLSGSQSNPGVDIANDCGGEAYVTGNGGGGAGDDDVDDGATWLISPVFDVSSMPDPHVRYVRWFFNGGGSGTPNDSLLVMLTNGTDTVMVETVTVLSPGPSAWITRLRRIQDYLAPSATMRMLVRVADGSPGHVLEAGIDGFEVLPNGTAGMNDASAAALQPFIWPVPSDGRLMLSDPHGTAARVELLDLNGRQVVHVGNLRSGGTLNTVVDVPAGVYLLRIIRVDGSRSVLRWVRQ